MAEVATSVTLAEKDQGFQCDTGKFSSQTWFLLPAQVPSSMLLGGVKYNTTSMLIHVLATARVMSGARHMDKHTPLAVLREHNRGFVSFC